MDLDLPVGSANSKARVPNLWFWPIFYQNCMKMKKAPVPGDRLVPLLIREKYIILYPF